MTSDSERSTHLLKELVHSNHKFTTSIYKNLISSKEDFIFSPISLQIALLLTHSGAYGATAEEMKSGLCLNLSKKEILEGAKLVLDNLKNPNLKIASQIFVEQQYVLKHDFKSELKQYLQSEFYAVDFKKSPSKATEIINNWVLEQTNKRISNLIPTGSLNEYTRLVLINAVHFKDAWRDRFSENKTFNQPFYTCKDNSVDIPMMHITKKYKFLEKESFRILEIPYKDGNFSMIIFLPKEIEELQKIEKELLEADLLEFFRAMKTVKVELTLPKFKMEKFIDMKEILKKLGMKTMFGDCADFSVMYEPGEDPLYVSDVLHKAVIEVNEEGSEAAAATAVKMLMKRSLVFDSEEIVEFQVDRPFIFIILHRHTILFIGKKTTF